MFPAWDDIIPYLTRELGYPLAIAEKLAAMARPAVSLYPTRPEQRDENDAPSVSAYDEPPPEREADAPLGASKLGGQADLPIGWSWPRRPPYPEPEKADWFHGGDGAEDFARSAPLSLLAQLRLSELGRAQPNLPGWPKTGRLWVFYDEAANHWKGVGPESPALRLLFEPDEAKPLVRAAFPADFAGEDPAWSRHPAMPLSARAAWSIPTQWYLPPEDLGLPDGGWSGELPNWVDLDQRWLDATGAGGVMRVGGWPAVWHGAPEASFEAMRRFGGAGDALEEDQRRVAKAHAGDWAFLFQLESPMAVGFTWGGGVGDFFVYLRKDDLAARRFDRAGFLWES